MLSLSDMLGFVSIICLISWALYNYVKNLMLGFVSMCSQPDVLGLAALYISQPDVLHILSMCASLFVQ